MAALGYSQRLAYLPISLFGMSVAAAALPAMSRDPSPAALRERLVNGWFQILFFVLPAALVLLLFGDLAVRLVYQRREFGVESTSLVAAVLAAYAIGLVAASSIKLFAAGFHALQDTATPMRVAVASVAIGVTTSLLLTISMRRAGFGAYSAVGIALGSAIGSWTNLVLLWFLLGRKLDGVFPPATLRGILRLVAASFAAVVAAYGVRWFLEPRLPWSGFAGTALLFAAVLAAGGIVYLGIARRPPSPECSSGADGNS